VQQIQTEVEQMVHDYIRDVEDDITQEDIIRHFKGQLSAETVKKTVAFLISNEIIMVHKHGHIAINVTLTEFSKQNLILL
jgi:hypothetical protein